MTVNELIEALNKKVQENAKVADYTVAVLGPEYEGEEVTGIQVYGPESFSRHVLLETD